MELQMMRISYMLGKLEALREKRLKKEKNIKSAKPATFRQVADKYTKMLHVAIQDGFAGETEDVIFSEIIKSIEADEGKPFWGIKVIDASKIPYIIMLHFANRELLNIWNGKNSQLGLSVTEKHQLVRYKELITENIENIAFDYTYEFYEHQPQSISIVRGKLRMEIEELLLDMLKNTPMMSEYEKIRA